MFINEEKIFSFKSVNEKVGLLNSTLLLNIFRNYIPNKRVKCSYRDPPLITKEIKSKQTTSKITKEFYRKGQDPTIFDERSRISRVCTDLRNANMN